MAAACCCGLRELVGSVMPGNGPMPGLMSRLRGQLHSGHTEVTARVWL